MCMWGGGNLLGSVRVICGKAAVSEHQRGLGYNNINFDKRVVLYESKGKGEGVVNQLL